MQATERIDFRTTITVKLAIQKAAERLGVPMSAFVAQNAYEAAQRVLAEEEHLIFSDRDRDIFLEAMEKPHKANSALKALLRKKP